MPDTHIWRVAERVLTEKQLEAFTLRYKADLPVWLIAAGLGISKQAVNDRLEAGQRKLRKEL